MSSRLIDIRRSFLDYFSEHDHAVVASAPLVPLDDPTLMFTNAGMVPFKDYFTGVRSAPVPRAVSAQKCVRAGGKHNDLDSVGYTARHHTFFEMLGNFSFGDYFKEEAILYAWSFLSDILELPRDRLLMTVYSEDDVSFDLWRKIAGVDDHRIIRISTSDNFWQMGSCGPCGPCSEVFYDHGSDIAGGPPGSKEQDGDRFVEIWNLVFMQFDQAQDGSRVALPRPAIDTGMGLERIAAVMQGTHDNYATDLMRGLMGASASASGCSIDGAHTVSHRVIADHLRAVSFLIADGVLPSNEGRGYVLRRIMRRAMRHAWLLSPKMPFLWQLVSALESQMAGAYPELTRAATLITETLRFEEERFRITLARGMKLLDDAVSGLTDQQLSGEIAFKLYDTYGFPLDLTQDALRERGLEVDLAGFEEAMATQRARARAHWAGSGAAATETLWYTLYETHGASEFLGYQATHAEGVVLAIIDTETLTTRDVAVAGDEVFLLLNQTPFYAESGGQIGDSGKIYDDKELEIEIDNTFKKLDALHVVSARIVVGQVVLASRVHQKIDAVRRRQIRANHSATHLLHATLRKVLGPHVTQKGSLVEADYLRFDFSQPKPIPTAELRTIEAMINDQIRQNEAVITRLMTPDEAIAKGALALFGEKYGDEVRVLTMGSEVDATEHSDPKGTEDSEGKKVTHQAMPFSIELCGGTHVERLGDIGLFKIIHETAVAAGVRRIEARTGAAAFDYITTQGMIIDELTQLFKTSTTDITARATNLLTENRALARTVEAQNSEQLKKTLEQAEIQTIGDIKFLGQVLTPANGKNIQALMKHARNRLASGVIALIGLDADKKAMLAVSVSDDLTTQHGYDAAVLVQVGVRAFGGKGGGGSPQKAQAGGNNISPEAANTAITEISQHLKT